MFSSRLSLSVLIELCRSLRHYLGAGLTVLEVFQQQAKRGPAALRPVAGRIADVLQHGDALEDALEQEQAAFPPLFVSLASVGEHTGMLPEVFHELEEFFVRQQRLRRQFIAQTAWPVIQFFLAVAVLALLILILGQLTPAVTPQGQPYDPLGFGLRGVGGAAVFLAIVLGPLAAAGIAYVVVARLVAQQAAVDRFLLNLPAVGPCLQALALGRFCLALQLTTESGMSIKRALRLSLRATGNSAYTSATARVEATVAAGDEVTDALAATGLFPDDLIRSVAVAEESGRLSEVMRHQGEFYHEEASRRLAILTAVAGYVVWAVVGLFIIIAIFRLYGSYLSLLNSI
ncbi:MAG: type II secretion system F family protein [Gemmataceae bacterium]